MDEFRTGKVHENATTVGFSDPFANGVIWYSMEYGKERRVRIYENTSDNLIMSLSSGSVNGRAAVCAVHTHPVVPENKILH